MCGLDRCASVDDHASSLSSSNGRNDVEYQLRLCHVVEWPDFTGFGFNVHTMRDKPGQYVGKVDTGSPAAAAGLASVLSLVHSLIHSLLRLSFWITLLSIRQKTGIIWFDTRRR